MSVHAPVADDCTQCHDPHNSDAKFHLKAADEKTLCLTCHGDMDPAFKENILTAQFKHKPVEEGSCGECHNPHASDFGQLLRSDTKQICFECHQNLGKIITGSEYVHAPVESDGCNACHNVHGSGNLLFSMSISLKHSTTSTRTECINSATNATTQATSNQPRQTEQASATANRTCITCM
ncbi:MAG: cytochrome c3 family protein [Geovibrio sp.]|nr:cytochrome c3 family protein [Geovibrio sp.]